MSPNTPTVVLPAQEEMTRRLASLQDHEHVVKRFHPILLKSAGQEKSGPGVVMMLTLAIHDYTQGMTGNMADDMTRDCSKYLDILIDDEVVKADAKEFLRISLGRA